METASVLALTEQFAALEDPRVERTRLHPLLRIIGIAVCAVIAGAETWDEIAEFGTTQAAWFGRFLDLPNGIPAHDTFNRVFAALDPEQFRAGFLRWTTAVANVLPAEVIALDGKTLRHSHDRGAGKAAIHIVSAWAATNRLVLAQVKVAAKSNEITAIPELLPTLALSGCIVTIDAMGCQRTIAQQIVDQAADYVLALKENQGTLFADVIDTFAQYHKDLPASAAGSETSMTTETGHGREEVRRHWVVSDPAILAWLQEVHHWPGLGAIGMVQAQRTLGGQTSTETRYYLLSRQLSAATFGAAVRSHWGIENQVHWVLDLAFREDASRIRAGYAAENVAVLRHLALNLIRHTPRKQLRMKARRLAAGWDHAYLLQILQEL